MLLGVEPPGQVGADAFLEIVVIGLVELRRFGSPLRLAGFRLQFFERGADFLDLGVAKLDGIDHGFFFDFLRARLDHHDGFGRADDHDVQQALAHLVVRGIHDELPVDQAHAHGADGAKERNVRKRERSRCAVDAEHVGIVIAVGRQYEGDHLGFALEAFGKHGPDGAVNLAAGEHFALAHAAFALDEAAGETPAGVGVFAVIDREREKIDALAGIGIGGGRSQYYVFAQPHYGGAMGLLG